MKQKYEKPMVIDLNITKAWGGDITPEGLCYTGTFVGSGVCEAGLHPAEAGLCFDGAGDSGNNLCSSGVAV